MEKGEGDCEHFTCKVKGKISKGLVNRKTGKSWKKVEPDVLKKWRGKFLKVKFYSMLKASYIKPPWFKGDLQWDNFKRWSDFFSNNLKLHSRKAVY